MVRHQSQTARRRRQHTDNKAVDHDNKAVDRPAPDLKPKPKDRAAPGVPAKIRAMPFKAFDEATLRPRAFLYGKHYQRGQAMATIGCDGAGKSTVAIAEAHRTGHRPRPAR